MTPHEAEHMFREWNPSPDRSPAPEAARRRRDWDESVGTLAPSEEALMNPRVRSIGNAYERALVVTQGARAKLIDALTGEDSGAIWRAADNYALTSIALWRAAEAVCDCENLPANGEAEGVVWRVPMIERDSAEQAGARLADEAFCQGCGARGYRSLCPSCQRDANGAGR